MKKTSSFSGLRSARGKAATFAVDYNCAVSIRKANAKSKFNGGTRITHRSSNGKAR